MGGYRIIMKKYFWGLFLLLFFFSSFCFGENEKHLTVYTYSSFPIPLIELVQNHFQKALGVKVEFKSFSDTGPLFNQLIQEKQNPVADFVIGLDNNYLVKAQKYNLFQPYRPKATARIDRDLIFDRHFLLTPFDYGYIVFNYDREKLGRIPHSYKDLLDPYYKGKIVIENPQTSSPGQIFLLTTIALYGEKGYLNYWRVLKKNILTIAPGWDEAYGMYTNGEAPIVLSYGTSPVYHLLHDHTERYQPLVLDGVAYAQIEAMGVVKGTRNSKLAEALADYVLDPQFQSLIPENQYMYPVRRDIPLPDSFRIAAHVKKLLNLPTEKVANNLERWLDQWEKVINE
ncbi:MAG TPA: thiamine ABC transporter substrate-binding protein [Firmicutes bacterium]|jgi:thiamine transport system substrate-binding protein|nr:thiamine ABC transporter substrate-binding protein [Bacillota bacterium]